MTTSPNTGQSSPCGGGSRESKSGPLLARRELQGTRTEKTTALSRLKTGAGGVETFVVLEMASGIRPGESFLVFMVDERDRFQQWQVERRKPAVNHVDGMS